MCSRPSALGLNWYNNWQRPKRTMTVFNNFLSCLICCQYCMSEMKVQLFKTAFSVLFFQLTCRPGAVVFVPRKKSSKTEELCNCLKDTPVRLRAFIPFSPCPVLKCVEKTLQPWSLEQSWVMKPCLSVIVTEENSLISQRYYPLPLLLSLPPPLPPFIHCSPGSSSVRPGLEEGNGPLSLCLREGWMGLGPCPQLPYSLWIGPRFPLFISLGSSFSDQPSFLADPYFKVFGLRVPCSRVYVPITPHCSLQPHLSCPQAALTVGQKSI